VGSDRTGRRPIVEAAPPDCRRIGQGTDVVTAINVKYFDTIPLCVSLNVLKTGFLFAAAEFGNHVLYQFQGIGDDNDDEELQQVIPRPVREFHECLRCAAAALRRRNTDCCMFHRERF
jgi:hypothetical protein